ncbi:hypothetical protein BGZ60DRAFT_277549 [Tricladium varicosporioides]|nr:hypothetical protein BGZ60DRAFT_277549 [Hymenoscyphus varicosporioides]
MSQLGVRDFSTWEIYFWTGLSFRKQLYNPTKQPSTMAPEVAANKSAKASKQEFDIISNRVALALAKRESLIKSWTTPAARSEAPTKSLEELEAEDAILFHNEPAHLGVGAPVPAEFLASDVGRSRKSLRAKFFPVQGLKASKARDAEEKAASAKRGIVDESSDDEEGRSGLGRAKKQRKSSLQDALDRANANGDSTTSTKQQKPKSALKESLAKILLKDSELDEIKEFPMSKQISKTSVEEQGLEQKPLLKHKPESSLKQALNNVNLATGEDKHKIAIQAGKTEQTGSKIRKALAELESEDGIESEDDEESTLDSEMMVIPKRDNGLTKADLKKKRKNEKKKLRKQEKKKMGKIALQEAEGVTFES